MDLPPAKWGSGVSLHGSNPEPLMSALGQKQTSEHDWIMSALLPESGHLLVFDRNYVAF